MSIAERLLTSKEDGPPWQTCSIQWIKSKIDEKEQEALEALISERNVTFNEISKIIREEVGINVSPTSISRHCRSLCRCEVSK